MSADQLLALLETALNSLWARAHVTLGEVTLTAIAERVLHTAGEKFPLLSTITVAPSEGFQYAALREQPRSARDFPLLDAARALLVELLTVIGTLTAEILTPDLHAELSAVALSSTAAVPATDPHTSKDGRGS